jgi:hypothetical protein
MRPIGRNHKRLPRFLAILAILMVAWWVSTLGVPRGEYQELALFHENQASSYRRYAESPIIEHQIEYRFGTDRVCRRIERHMSAADVDEANRARKQAGYVAIYHNDLKRKYWRAAWIPWLTIEPDPAAPKFLGFVFESVPTSMP